MMDWNEEDALGKGYDGRLLRRFLGCVRPHAGWVALTGVLLLARIAADLSAPVLLQRCIDGPMAARDLEGIRSHALLFLAAVVAAGLLEYAYSGATNRVGQRIILELRLRLFAHLQRLSVSFFDKNPVGRLNVRITNDVENLNELFTSGLVEFAADLLMIAGVVAMMFVTSWKLALVTMAVTPLVLGITLLFRKTARERYRAMRLTIAKLNSTLNENINGMRTIQTFGRQASSLEGFRKRNAEYRDSAIAAMFAYSIFFPGIELLFSLGMSLLVWTGGTAILGGTLKLGAFLAFWYYVHKFFMPVREIAEKFNILQAAMASSERVFGILDTPPAVDDRPGARPAPPLRGEVEFDGVSFSYDGKTPVLRELSFRLEPGRSLAVVGLTGAGKSTLINLLLRFYDPVSGAVRVDGRDLRELELRSVRRQMGLVLQDVFLFSGTVEENLRLGEPGITRQRLEAAARAVNADHFIARLPKGFENPILERGAALSSGERQLLSFARALAFDPRILVLDEATSSVDAETERLVQDGLGRLLEGRTSLVVAHRLSTIRRCDRILVLHEGRMREEGTHAELLAKDGMYRRLYRLQLASTGATPAPAGPLLETGGAA
jgi:ATP-binding cassette subfamily B protein